MFIILIYPKLDELHEVNVKHKITSAEIMVFIIVMLQYQLDRYRGCARTGNKPIYLDGISLIP